MSSSSQQLHQPAWMSWWDKYFAPGDIRAQRSQSLAKETAQEEAQPAPIIPHRVSQSERARRQNALLFGGFAFTFLSAFVTRRALVRKKHITSIYPHLTKRTTKGEQLNVPHFTTSNNQAKAEGGLDAAEALFLATLNVGAVFMAATGGFMKFFDIADTEDLRDFVRSGVGYDVYAGDSAADKEMEEWVAGVLARKDGGLSVGGLQESLAEKLKELEDIEKRKEQKGEGEKKA